jgi:hypothetical protein
MTEIECFKPLHAVAEDLAARGATPGAIATALVDVALRIAERDRDYATPAGQAQAERNAPQEEVTNSRIRQPYRTAAAASFPPSSTARIKAGQSFDIAFDSSSSFAARSSAP